MTDSAETYMGLALADCEAWARVNLTFRDKLGVEHTGLDPKQVQLEMFAHDRACRLAGVPCKMLVYKSRRMGASTAAQGIIYHRLQGSPNLTAKLMANTDKTAGEVSDIFKLMAKKDRFPWAHVKGPAVIQDVSGRTTLASGSAYVDLSAHGEEPGRGGAAQIANLTESPFYPETGDPIRGFLPSVEAAFSSAVGCIIADFTPNGPTGWTYEMVMLALKREAASTQTLADWKLIFVPWWKDRDATRPFASEQARKDFAVSLRTDELEEWENHDPKREQITLEAMHWRRMIIEGVIEGSVDKFRTEYASSVREGFMRSARHCFNLREMQGAHVAATGCKPIKRGGISMNGDKAVWVSDENGMTTIWEDPIYGLEYIEAWDTMTGADQASGGAKSKPDWQWIQIWRAEYREGNVIYPPRMVARHRSQWPVRLAALEAHGLSVYYGTCMIFPEINNSGYGAVLELENLGARIFARKVAGLTLVGTETANGWMTTDATRKTIVSVMEKAIRTRMIDCPDPEFWEECLSFVIEPKKGKPQALDGQHDDGVMCGAIALSNMGAASRMDMPVRRRVSEAELLRRGGLALPDGTRLEESKRPVGRDSRERFG